MLRRDMIKVAGAGLLAPLLPESKAEPSKPSVIRCPKCKRLGDLESHLDYSIRQTNDGFELVCINCGSSVPWEVENPIVPTPVVVVNGRRVPVLRYDEGEFLDGDWLVFQKDGKVVGNRTAQAVSLTRILDVIERHPLHSEYLQVVLFVDRNGHFCYDCFPEDGVPDKVTRREVQQSRKRNEVVRYLSDRCLARGISIKDMVRQAFASLGRI